MPAENIIATHDDVRNSGCLAVTAERDVAVLARRQPDDEDDEAGRDEREEPADVVHDPARGRRRALVLRLSVLSEAPEHEGDGDRGGDAEDDLVEVLRLLCRVLLEREVEGGVQGLLEGACLPRRIDGRGGSGVGQLCAHAVTAPRVAGRLSFVFSSVTYQARTVDGPPCRQRGQRPNRTARQNASARLVPLWHNEVHVCRESHHTGAGSGVRSRVAAAAWGRAASPWRP